MAQSASNPDLELPSYTSYIEREMGTVVNTVKVLQSKPENLVDTFLLLMPVSCHPRLQRACKSQGVLGRER